MAKYLSMVNALIVNIDAFVDVSDAKPRKTQIFSLNWYDLVHKVTSSKGKPKISNNKSEHDKLNK